MQTALAVQNIAMSGPHIATFCSRIAICGPHIAMFALHVAMFGPHIAISGPHIAMCRSDVAMCGSQRPRGRAAWGDDVRWDAPIVRGGLGCGGVVVVHHARSPRFFARSPAQSAQSLKSPLATSDAHRAGNATSTEHVLVFPQCPVPSPQCLHWSLHAHRTNQDA
jgi:hypothetical protein